MTNHVYVQNHTAGGVLAHSLAPTVSFRLKEVRIHLSAAGGAVGNVYLTAAVDAINGAAYDLKFINTDMTTLTDYVWQPDHAMQFEAGDQIDFAYANGSSRTYGLTIVYESL